MFVGAVVDGSIPLETIGLVVLLAAAFFTSMLSAVVGMAGGITLLAVMLELLPALVVIPLHGVVQLVSNSSRTVIQRRHVRWDVIRWYVILIVPLGYAGVECAQALPEKVLHITIGAFVLIATWARGFLMLGSHPERVPLKRRFFILGGVTGFLNPAIGATGPLIAPFFLNLGFTRFQIIGTKAACQAFGHLAKIVLFATVAHFAFGDYAVLILYLSAMVILGTWVGSRVLHRVNERAFVIIYKAVLSLLALRLVMRGVWVE